MHRFFALAALLVASSANAATFDVDNAHTSVIFSVQHFGAAWVFGRFDKSSGSFDWDKDPTKVKVSLSIDASSVNTNNTKRDDHLKGADFFDAAQFSAITFTSKSCKAAGEGLECTGTLSLHGVSKDITIPVKFTGEGDDPWGGHRAGVISNFSVKRSDFGMKTMLEGVSDEVKLIVALEGVQKK